MTSESTATKKRKRGQADNAGPDHTSPQTSAMDSVDEAQLDAVFENEIDEGEEKALERLANNAASSLGRKTKGEAIEDSTVSDASTRLQGVTQEVATDVCIAKPSASSKVGKLADDMLPKLVAYVATSVPEMVGLTWNDVGASIGAHLAGHALGGTIVTALGVIGIPLGLTKLIPA